MDFRRIKTAVIGCGEISYIYMLNFKKLDIIDLVGCSDIIPESAEKRAVEFNIKAMTNEEIFSSNDIELVVITTTPLHHYNVAKEALLSGKSVYCEKTICVTLDEAKELKQIAKEKTLFFGGAPETFFSSAMQIARNILDSGILGVPVMAQAFLSRSYRHHRDSANSRKRFVYCEHGGILYDMGAYYLTAMVFLLGAIKRVIGFSAIREPERIYQNPQNPNYGEKMIVESTNTATGSLLFENGVMGTFTMTSEGTLKNHFCIYCTDGYIDLGDPNEFENTIHIYNKNGEESVITSPFAICGDNFRGYGVAEAMYAHLSGKKARCNSELCTHVLEAALGLSASSETGCVYDMTTSAERPLPFKPGYFENPELSLKY